MRQMRQTAEPFEAADPLELTDGERAGTDRRDRFARSGDPDALVLTSRDEGVVLDCWRYRWLTRQQIQRLTSTPGIRRLNGRLRRLYDHGYLDRLRAGTIGMGLQPIYVVGPAGVPLVAGRLDLPEGTVKERVRETLRASPLLLPHDLSVNDVLIALLGAFGNDPDTDLRLWQNARDCYDAYAPGRSLRPDGYLQVLEGGRTLHSCILEVDRGTVGLEKWAEKVKRYREYREGGFYSNGYGPGLTRFRVLTLTHSLARLEHLCEATRSVTDRGFWFTLAETLLSDPDPRRAIWKKVDGTEPASLL